MAKYGKIWQNMARFRERPLEYGKIWRNMAKLIAVYLLNMAKYGRIWQNMAKYGKIGVDLAL